MLRVKASARMDFVKPVMLIPAYVYGALRDWHQWGDGTITSGTDGADSYGAPRFVVDPHDYGFAIDLRLNDLLTHQRKQLVYELRAILDYLTPDVFRVVEEVDHLHIQLSAWRSLAGV